MKIRAAVLETIGAPQPFDENRPLTIEELELDPPGDHEVLFRYGQRVCAIQTCP